MVCVVSALGKFIVGSGGGLAGYPEVMGKLSALLRKPQTSVLGTRSPSRRHAPCAGTRFRPAAACRSNPFFHRSWT